MKKRPILRWLVTISTLPLSREPIMNKNAVGGHDGRVGDLAAAGCSSNQEIKTTDDRTIVTDGKPKVDSDTGYPTKMPIQAEPNRSTVTKLPT